GAGRNGARGRRGRTQPALRPQSAAPSQRRLAPSRNQDATASLPTRLGCPATFMVSGCPERFVSPTANHGRSQSRFHVRKRRCLLWILAFKSSPRGTAATARSHARHVVVASPRGMVSG